MKYRHLISFTIVLLVTGLLCLNAAVAKGKPSKITVGSVSPNVALQGEELDVVISGSGFGHGSTVRFLVTDTRDDSQIDVVGTVVFDEGAGTLKAKIHVKDMAVVNQYDIEVRTMSGRKGKGTTLFRVEKAGNGGPLTPDKNGAEYIIFSGKDLVGAGVVEGCCLNRGPHPAYTMRLSEAFGDFAGTHDGHLYISGGGGMHGYYMVEFWVEGEFGFGFYFIGGVIERDRKNKLLTVTFTDEQWYWHDPKNELPIEMASFVLERYPAD